MSDDTTDEADTLSGDEAAAFLTSDDELTHTATVAGRDVDLVVEEVDLDEVRELNEQLQAGELTERDVIDTYLLAPDVDTGAIGVSKRDDLFVGINEAWRGGDRYDDAEAAIETPDEGNG
jgi:hypothetical protein